MCCMQLVGNTGRKNDTKNRHLCTTAQLCRVESSPLRHVSTMGRKLAKQQYLLHMSSQYGELRPTSSSDRFGSLGHPSKFQRVSCLGFVTAATLFTGGQPCAQCLAVSCTATLYTFSGVLAPDRISPRAKFTLRPSLAFCDIGSVTARHSSSGVSQTLRRGTRNCFTELSRRAPLICGWAAIKLGIGPHSS